MRNAFRVRRLLLHCAEQIFSQIFIICSKIHKGSVSCPEGGCKEVSSVFLQTWILVDHGPVFLKGPSPKLG